VGIGGLDRVVAEAGRFGGFDGKGWGLRIVSWARGLGVGVVRVEG
jgi:hypothetical protein